MANPNDPATEQTLKKLVDVLSKAFPAAGSRAVGGGKTERNEGSTSSDRSDKVAAAKQQKTIVATARSLEKLSGAANRSANSLTGVSKQSDKVKGSFVGLNSSLSATMKSLSLSRAEIRKINFGGIAGEIEKAVAQSMEGLKEPKEKVSAGKTVARFADLMDNRVNPRLEKFTRVLRLTSNALVGFLRELREGAQSGDLAPRARSRRRAAPASFPVSWSLEPMDGSGPADGTIKKGFDARKKKTTVNVSKPKKEPKIKAEKPSDKKATPKDDEVTPDPKKIKDFDDALVDMLKKRGLNSTAIMNSTMALGVFGVVLSRITQGALEVLDDAFQVMAARGYGTTDSLGTLYWSSIQAGMSLREFVQVLDKNMIAVSRASSFAEFQKNLKVGADGLKKYGVFGENAAELTATMMSASTSLGVPQAQMEDAIKAQTKSFAELRKTTNITAREFAALTQTIASDANVRTELSALAPAERLARQQELIDQAAYARSLNLSEAEVNKFTQAILDQRKSTVKQRFQQAGRLTQAAGMLGMDQGKVDQLRKLSMNKYKTKEEQIQYQALLGEVNTGIEKMQQSGQPGSQFQADTIRENLTGAGVDLDTASAIQAGKQSGDVKNADLGKELGKVAQAVGSLMTFLEGLTKNPLASIAIAVGTGIAAIGASMIGFGTIVGRIAGGIIASAINGRGIGGSGPDVDGPGNRRSRKRRGQGKPGANTPTGIEAPDFTTDLGADGSGGDRKGAPKTEGKPKGKWAGRASAAGRGLGRVGVPLIGSAISIGMAGMEYAGAEEAAKEENGGDGDIGKAKGEAVGSGVGSTIGAIAGGAIGAIGGPLGIALGASLGGMLGDFTGRWLGGLAGSETAAEKNARETKKNTEEMIKARRAKAGPDVITTDNLGSITQNALQTAKAYTTPDAAELAKYADSKKTPEQRAAEKKEKVDAEVAKTTKAQWAQYEQQAMATLPKEGRTVGMVEKEKERLARIDAEKRVTEVAGSAAALAAVAVPQAATPVQQAPAVIATPASQVQGSVNPAAVNKTDVEAQAEATKKVVAAAIQSPTALSDPGEVLKQILEILKQSLAAENQQVELASTMLRAQSLTPYLPDKQSMVRRVMSQV